MRKIIPWLLCLVLLAGLGAAGASAEEERTELTVWAYPVGRWADEASVQALVESFGQARPDVAVTVTYLDGTDADETLDEAIQSGRTPDLVVGATEHLRQTWAAEGRMALLVYVTDPAPASDPEAGPVNWSFGTFDDGEAGSEAAGAFVDHVCAAAEDSGAQVITEEMLAASRRAAERRLEERGGC